MSLNFVEYLALLGAPQAGTRVCEGSGERRGTGREVPPGNGASLGTTPSVRAIESVNEFLTHDLANHQRDAIFASQQ